MKTYTIYFSEPVSLKIMDQRWNGKHWEDFENEIVKDTFVFHNLTNAKKFIKEHIDKYVGSCITKTWANGDWENLGEIKLKGNNKTFVANTKQKSLSY